MKNEPRIAILADDERCLRALVAKPLAKAGFTVVEAVDGQSAMEALTRHTSGVRALVTDICMPGDINGLELAQSARRMLPDISILVCSGTITPTFDVMPDGARFLRKPYSMPELTSQIGYLAARCQSKLFTAS